MPSGKCSEFCQAQHSRSQPQLMSAQDEDSGKFEAKEGVHVAKSKQLQIEAKLLKKIAKKGKKAIKNELLKKCMSREGNCLMHGKKKD